MDRYTLIFVADERSPVRRFQLPKVYVKRLIWALVVAALLFAGASWDYWRKWVDNAELAGLRVEAAEQREQIERFETTLRTVEAELARVNELERKVRIIANLPGAAAVGGDDVTEVVPAGAATGETQQPMLPVGVPGEIGTTDSRGAVRGLDVPVSSLSPEQARRMGLTSERARYIHGLDELAGGIGSAVSQRAESLELMIDQLEDKRVKLASMPSIWPARGWLTSRFGSRVSPFTGRAQRHVGIDIAAGDGTPIIAPARGRVSYVGRKGPLGNTLVLDHGFGVQTVYGHTREILVKPGAEVARGQLIAAMGSTGRSTGPHLHYVVEVKGKPRNPLDYIFD